MNRLYVYHSKMDGLLLFIIVLPRFNDYSIIKYEYEPYDHMAIPIRLVNFDHDCIDLMCTFSNLLCEGPKGRILRRNIAVTRTAVSPGRCKPQRRCQAEFWEPVYTYDTRICIYIYTFMYIMYGFV